MHEKIDKQMDNLVKKVILKASLETPSFDFTAQIMTQLAAKKQSESTIYKPLISRTVWIAIFVGFVVLIAYSFFGMQQESQNWILDFGVLTYSSIFDQLPEITVSKTVSYALVSLSIMVLIQVSVLKDYLDKRFEN
ncbi:hypothetical protein [Flavobacterium frigoris]|uniref:Uncharacterized protein n=1 Tax=Flavobacterium frigoris TaxID=229204 RepID=A0A1H9F817_FLAFI|nr:hypothetical protein [Flavobacterium frigoris]SEQ33428.1 hypothetical protein SAMN05444355_10292 [Flavobacterium frigoris]